MNTIETIITAVALIPWAVYMILVTRGVFRKEEDLFAPVHKKGDS